MDNYLSILNLKNREYIFEEDFVDILTTQLNISISDSIRIISSLHLEEAKSIIFSIINNLDVSKEDKIKISEAILSIRFTPIINKNINTLFEKYLISVIDVYTKNTNGFTSYKTQALCILSILTKQLPIYFKSYGNTLLDIDEADIKSMIDQSINLLKEEYPNLAMRLNTAILKNNWCNERLYFSYMSHLEIMGNEFVRKK